MTRLENRFRVLIFSIVAAVGWAAARADDGFTKSVPSDVNLFVELRGNADLLLPLTDAHVWSTLAELAGQPASADDAAEWRRRVNHTLLMEPEDAIKLLFARGVAFVSGSQESPHEAALMCRLDEKTSLMELATRWQARPLPSAEKATVYQLRNGIGLGALDRLMVFGDASKDGKLFANLLHRAGAGGEHTLADDPTYKRLLARVPADPDGLLFARLAHVASATSGQRLVAATQAGAAAEGPPLADAGADAESSTQPTAADAAPAAQTDLTATTSGPAKDAPPSVARRRPAADAIVPELPGPLRGASTILLALHRKGNMLHYSAVGDAAPRHAADTAQVARLVESLPERTLAAWGAQFDYGTALEAANALPTQNMLRLAVGTQQAVLGRLFAALEPSACVAIGVAPSGEPDAIPALPAIALILQARDAAAADAAATDFMHSLVSIYNLLSLRAKLPQLTAEVGEQIADVSAHTIDLTPLLEPYVGKSMGDIRLAWARDNDALIIASHPDWLRQIINARHGRGPDLSRVTRLTQRPLSSRSETVIVVQSGPIGDLCSDWLTFLETQYPDVLREQWWRGRQPVVPRLGLNVAEVQAAKRLQIVGLERGSPAQAALRVGDQIVGCEGRRFATSQPVNELRDALPQRKNARKFELLVERGGVMTPITLSIPYMDPIAVLRRIAALGAISQRVVYHDDVPDGDAPRGFLSVELRTGKSRLFPTFSGDLHPIPASPDGK